jgi:hypothetical protein
MLTQQSRFTTANTALARKAMMRGNDNDLYWQEQLERLPFYIAGLTFDDYAPAFRMGHARYRDDTLFEDVQRRFGAEWEDVKGASRLAWFEARHAVRAAWERAGNKAQQRALN